MKKCPFCAEEIQKEAIKCKHCGEFLAGKKPAAEKWYLRNSTIIVLFLCVGPFALPLVWWNPKYGRTAKIIITLVSLVLSYYLTLIFAHSIQSIMSYYQELQTAMGDIT